MKIIAAAYFAGSASISADVWAHDSAGGAAAMFGALCLLFASIAFVRSTFS